MAGFRSIGYEIAKVHKAVRANLQGLLAPHGVTVQQFEVMRILEADAGITAAQLVERIISDSSTMMSILRRLESKALIVRMADKTDRRTRRIFLTEEGRHLAETLAALADRRNRRMQDCCSAQELRVFKHVLSKLYAFSTTGGSSLGAEE